MSSLHPELRYGARRCGVVEFAAAKTRWSDTYVCWRANPRLAGWPLLVGHCWLAMLLLLQSQFQLRA